MDSLIALSPTSSSEIGLSLAMMHTAAIGLQEPFGSTPRTMAPGRKLSPTELLLISNVERLLTMRLPNAHSRPIPVARHWLLSGISSLRLDRGYCCRAGSFIWSPFGILSESSKDAGRRFDKPAAASGPRLAIDLSRARTWRLGRRISVVLLVALSLVKHAARRNDG